MNNISGCSLFRLRRCSGYGYDYEYELLVHGGDCRPFLGDIRGYVSIDGGVYRELLYPVCVLGCGYYGGCFDVREISGFTVLLKFSGFGMFDSHVVLDSVLALLEG